MGSHCSRPPSSAPRRPSFSPIRLVRSPTCRRRKACRLPTTIRPFNPCRCPAPMHRNCLLHLEFSPRRSHAPPHCSNRIKWRRSQLRPPPLRLLLLMAPTQMSALRKGPKTTRTRIRKMSFPGLTRYVTMFDWIYLNQLSQWPSFNVFFINVIHRILYTRPNHQEAHELILKAYARHKALADKSQSFPPSLSATDLERIGVPYHYEPKDFSDRVALRLMKFLRVFVHAFFREKYDHHAVCLETVAAIPGMVASFHRHFRSLRRMKRDHGCKFFFFFSSSICHFQCHTRQFYWLEKI